jgi:hypothetical protein
MGSRREKEASVMPNLTLQLLEMLDYLYGPLQHALATIDPFCALYGLLAATYSGAAYAASANNHQMLCRCYVLSAALHGLISLCHHLQV